MLCFHSDHLKYMGNALYKIVPFLGSKLTANNSLSFIRAVMISYYILGTSITICTKQTPFKSQHSNHVSYSIL